MATKDDAARSFFVFVKDANTGKIVRVAFPSDVQIGMQDNPSELTLLGRFSINTGDYASDKVNKGTINVTSSDTIICVTRDVTPLSGRIRLNLPKNPRNGQLHFIKDMTGTASTTPIDIYPPTGILIDGLTFKTLSDDGGSLAVFWFGNMWHLLVAGIGASGGGGGATPLGSFVTVNSEPSLANARKFTWGTAMAVTDGGPGGNLTVNLGTIGGVAGSYTMPDLTIDNYGRVTAALSNSSSFAPAAAAYVTIGNNPSLTAERALAVGYGLGMTDGGANGTVTLYATIGGGAVWTDGGSKAYTTGSISITKDGVFADSYGPDTYFFVSGSRSGPVRGAGQNPAVAAFGGDIIISGALWLNTGGIRMHGAGQSGTGTPAAFIVAGMSGSGLGFTDVAGGTLFQVSDVSGLSVFQVNDNDTVIMGEPFKNALYVSGSWVAVGGVPTDKSFKLFVSGGLKGSGPTLLGGTVSIDGPLTVTGSGGGQITGSITRLSDGRTYLIAGTGVTIASNSFGQVNIAVDPNATIGTDANASYLVLNATASLNSERVLSVSGTTGLLMTDAGANSTVTLRINDNVVATVSGTTFTGAVNGTTFTGTTIKGTVGLSGSLTHLADGTSYLLAGPNIQITSGTNGAVTIIGIGGGGSGNWVDGVGKLYTTGSISVDSRGLYADSTGINIFQFFSGTVGLTGSTGQIAAFGGDINVTGSIFVGPLSSSIYNRHVVIRTASIEFDDLHRLEFPPSASYMTWWGGFRTQLGQVGVNVNAPSASLHVAAPRFDGTFENYDIGPLDRQPFYTYGNLGWSRTTAQANGGSYSAGAGAISTGQSTTLACQVTMGSTWRPTFYYKTSIHSSDYLSFYVNGSLQQQWNGVQGWSAFVGNWQPPGSYTLTWTYVRNNTGATNQAWIDDVILQPLSGSVYNAAVFESGSVGIGVSRPLATLHVSGTTIHQGQTEVTSGSLYARQMSGSLTKLVDGTSYLIAGTGIQITTGSNEAVTISTIGGGSGGAKVPVYTLQMATAMQTTNFLSSSKRSIGVCYWDPAVLNQFSGSKQIMWRAAIECADVTFPAAVDLYDAAGTLYGIPGIVTGSILSASSLGVTQVQADITAELTATLTPLLLEARLWMTVSSSTGMYVTCKNARLDVLFS